LSTTTLQFELRQGGTLTDPDGNSVLLSDATGTYGARRTDTLATVVADGTPMVRQSAGVYTYDVTDPAAGLTYQWVAEYAVNGVTKHDTFTAYAYGSGVVGFWSSQSQVEQQYGKDNTGLDADLDDDGTGTASVWQAALNFTDALIDRIFRVAGYSRPTDLSLSDYVLASGYAAAIVRNELHKARGSTEANAAGGPSTGGVYQKDADAAVASLEEMAEQGVAFPRPGTDAGGQGNAPVVLHLTQDEYGRPIGPASNYMRPYFDSLIGGYRWS